MKPAVLVLLAAAAASAFAEDAGRPADLTVWRLEGARLTGSTDAKPRPVGSLMKPFVAKAWAAAHPGEALPRVRCLDSSGCWLPRGHGEAGLPTALAVSCNTYFMALARQTPEKTLARVLTEAGFRLRGRLSPEAAIGRDDATAAEIRPGDLLAAYARLVHEPWTEGEAVRRDVLLGLRESARRGTAKGLGPGGYWAKTGTVVADGAAPWRTAGLVLAVDDAGTATLARMDRGTGRQAAKALGGLLSSKDGRRAPVRADASGGSLARVTVSLLEALRPQEVVARNASGHPLATSRGYVGKGGVLRLRAGDRLSEGLWSLSVPGLAFRRDVQGSLSCEAGEGRVLRLRAEIATDEYVAGVLDAELAGGDPELRLALGAAVIRFLQDGPRHARSEVCDTTHCAWFVGRGPLARWPAPRTPVLLSAPAGRSAAPRDAALPPGLFDRMLAMSLEPGPRQWSSDCGGEPLSAHAVWGNGDRRVWACPFHRAAQPRWQRSWTDEVVESAFGAKVTGLAVGETGGTWRLVAETATGKESLSYDDAHRRLAASLGWAGLPSPALRVYRDGKGWRAEGVGLGHRVGLCLRRGEEGPPLP